MAQRFVACDREQSFLMPPDVREWLPENHLAWFVISAVEEMNLEPFYAAYRVDGRCRPPYDPAMMVALLVYAYSRGIPSSRVIERACVLAASVSRAGVRRPEWTRSERPPAPDRNPSRSCIRGEAAATR
jgi:Transposase domain (DUF772)